MLHGHLPWVLHHGRWPHGEDWLYQAATETWLPLLEALDRCAEEGIRPGWTIGVMPILLEQLTHVRFQGGLRTWLNKQHARALRDAEDHADPHLQWLATEHASRIAGLLDAGGDIVGRLRAHYEAGRIELLSSNATHGYHPLLLHDASARAQIRAGLATSERHLGHRPKGVWLPECAYRGSGAWTPPVVHGDERQRAGVASLYADEGVDFFFVDTHLVQNGVPVATVDGDRIGLVEPDRAWGSPLEPVLVAEGGALTRLRVMARAPSVSEQVWSGELGYPGDGSYLEFHKRHGSDGLRYWRVTGSDVDQGDKGPYYPDAAQSTVGSHAAHFVDLVKTTLRQHEEATGRYGIVCAPFDAELFGHWWHEGPAFLAEVARRMHNDPDVDALTVSDALARVPPDKAVALPEGSWGAGGDHRVWLNEELRFYWEVAYRAEDRFLDLWHRAPWRRDERARELLSEMGRQLLLLQASDWPFVISTLGAVDYGMRRILDHAQRFDDLGNGLEDHLVGNPVDPVVTSTLERCRLVDPVFPDCDPSWWA